MSTIAYAALTTRRDEAQPGTSTSSSSPAVKTYVDAVAALVPAEVLTLHALMLTPATDVVGDHTTIKEFAVFPLFCAFAGLCVLSILLYVLPRLADKKLDGLDWVRSSIPPLAFVAWTMLQRATAFDAAVLYLKLPANDVARTYIGLLLAVALGLTATFLAKQADQKPPN
jgi:hypothetical protein